MSKENLENIIKGYNDADQFRLANRYVNTEALFSKEGLTEEVENQTPPVCVNIAHLNEMTSIKDMGKEFYNKHLNVTILGISSARGPKDLQDLLKNLGAGKVTTTAIDISDGIFTEVAKMGLDELICFQQDARSTGLPNLSQDLVLRDHLGNCCPPEIDKAINTEVGRIVKPNGISVVNITSGDLFRQSVDRDIIKFEQLNPLLGEVTVSALQNSVYDLFELAVFLPNIDLSGLRGKILEIGQNENFVVFGEDDQGHGEWFRKLDDHVIEWQRTGFNIMEIQSREGWDSHDPSLRCHRHIAVLKKST